jgi:hypothetical protein
LDLRFAYPKDSLDLLRAPSGISLAHVGRWLNRWDEFEDGVSQSNQANNRTNDVAENVVVEEDGSDEDVDYFMSASFSRYQTRGVDLQIPRPRNENRNEAYLETWGGIWNSNAPMARES